MTTNLSEPDKLFARGDAAAALAAYEQAPLDADVGPTKAKVYRMLDRAACRLRLSERGQARDLCIEAKLALDRSTNVFNVYAWDMHQRGSNEKALWLAECAMEFLDLSWGEEYPHVANTLVSTLDALGDERRIVCELAMHQLASPEFEPSKPLFARHQTQLDALWSSGPSPAQLEVMKRHFRWIKPNCWETLQVLVARLLERDAQTWFPEVEALLGWAQLDWQTARVTAAIRDVTLARRALRLLLDRWVDDRLADGAKPALRELVLGLLDDAPGLPADLDKALRSAHRRKLRDWPFEGATEIPALRAKLVAIERALSQKPATPSKKAAAASAASTKKTAARAAKKPTAKGR